MSQKRTIYILILASLIAVFVVLAGGFPFYSAIMNGFSPDMSPAPTQKTQLHKPKLSPEIFDVEKYIREQQVKPSFPETSQAASLSCQCPEDERCLPGGADYPCCEAPKVWDSTSKECTCPPFYDQDCTYEGGCNPDEEPCLCVEGWSCALFGMTWDDDECLCVGCGEKYHKCKVFDYDKCDDPNCDKDSDDCCAFPDCEEIHGDGWWLDKRDCQCKPPCMTPSGPKKCGTCEVCVDGECEYLCNECEKCDEDYGGCVPKCESCETCSLTGEEAGECIDTCEGCSHCEDGACQQECDSCQECVGSGARASCEDLCEGCTECEDGQCVDSCEGCSYCGGDQCVNTCENCQVCEEGWCSEDPSCNPDPDPNPTCGDRTGDDCDPSNHGF